VAIVDPHQSPQAIYTRKNTDTISHSIQLGLVNQI